MKTTKHNEILNPIVAQELLDLGRYLRELRSKRKLTISDMGERIGVDPRTVSKIEKGDPTVALGTFIEYLNILSLAQGFALRILGEYIHAIAAFNHKPIFSDDEMNF